MKFCIPIILIGSISGCVNIYSDNYSGIADARTIPGYISEEAPPRVVVSSDLEAQARILRDKGYYYIGHSSFISADGYSNSKKSLIAQAKKVGASVVLLSKSHMDTITGSMPITKPKTTTSYSSATASTYSPYGSVTTNGNATTTTYSSETKYIPFSVDRSNFFAAFFAKIKYRTGIIAAPTSDEIKRLIKSNSGVMVIGLIDDSPAFKADILVGDIVIKMQEETITSVDSFAEISKKYQGQEVIITINRDGEIIEKRLGLLSF